MDSIEEQGTKVLLDLKYFIQLAVQKKITWNALAFLLIDLAPTLEKSKRVIETLVQELEKWVSNVENDFKQDVIEMLDTNEKEATVQIQDHGEAEKLLKILTILILKRKALLMILKNQVMSHKKKCWMKAS